jgi:predicted SnoaL-like aldol condensation-catalyzing enzyme
MSVEQNRTAVKRLSEVIKKEEWSAFPDLFASNYVFHSAQEFRGPEGIKQYFQAAKKAFPNYSEKIERMVAEGDL